MPRFAYITVIVILFVSLLIGCNPSTENTIEDETNIDQSNPEIKTEELVNLTVWSYFDFDQSMIGKFKAKYPNMDITVKVIPYGEQKNTYLNALADGKGPDIMVIDSAFIAQFSIIDGLEDLLQEPFYAGRYESDFTEHLWKNHLTIDKSELFAIPWTSSPFVTYYRVDILEELGFPAEPNQLATFMENPENWLAMAEELKEHNKWISQWDSDAVEIVNTEKGMYDKEMNFLRNTDEFIQAYQMAKQVNSKGLDANKDIWMEVGQNAIRSGDLVMVYLGTWGEEQIRAWAPETEGKWRATRLPFGVNGWSGSTSLAINSYSPYKEEAWEFIQYIVTNEADLASTVTIPAYIPARNNPSDLERTSDFLGGQKAYAFYSEVTEEMVEYQTTPLDEKAIAIWRKGIIEAIERDEEAIEAIRKIEQKIEKELQSEREALLRYRQK
jgi:multiple sugar transport system substrate-binding protein